MFTIVETPLYIKMVDSLLTKEEQGELHTMISQNPDIGDVVSKSGGVRTVRFARQGGGKSGGVRVIYYNRLENGKIFMLLVYQGNRTIKTYQTTTVREKTYFAKPAFYNV